MAKWLEKTLGEVTAFIAKGIPPKYTEKESEKTIRVLNQKCNRNFEISYNESRIHDCEKKKVPVDKILRAGDVLINSTGTGTAGRVAQMVEVTVPTTIDGHMILIRPSEELDPIYYGYAVKSFQSQIEGLAEGSTGQTEINRRRLQDEVIIRYPSDKLVQKNIGRFLANIDEKIKTNKEINRNLSEQAETLFRSWFEAYEPWNGEMPTDWRQGALGDFVTIKRGGSPRPIQEYLSDEGLRWLKISDVSGLQSPYVLEIAEHIIEEGLKKTVYLEAGSLVLSNSATPGIPKILDVDSCIHDGWLYFPESQLSNYFLYLFYKSIRPKLVALGNGSVFTNLKTDILKGYSFSKPDDDTLYKFDKIVAPMFRMMREVARENQRLSEVRDSLLPKLMSGELDISDLNI
jgi:type I restriction enzyme S subunit